MSMCVLLLSLLWSLVKVNAQQTFPYVSFMDQTLANHSYVDLSLVWRPDIGGSDSVQCITDLGTCCSMADGAHRGDWYFPNGTRLPFNAPDNNTYEFRWSQRVDIRRRRYSYSDPNQPPGIYRCGIPTTAVHDDNTSVRDTVYVGLYTASGGNNLIVMSCCASRPGLLFIVTTVIVAIISGEMEALNGANPQFTLACISTGGPATTVTWTRDSTTVTQ